MKEKEIKIMVHQQPTHINNNENDRNDQPNPEIMNDGSDAYGTGFHVQIHDENEGNKVGPKIAVNNRPKPEIPSQEPKIEDDKKKSNDNDDPLDAYRDFEKDQY